MVRFLFVAVVLTNTAFAQAEPDAGSVNEAPPSVSAGTYSALLDTHWVTRDAAESIKQQDLAVHDGLKAFGTDYELLWRSARHKWFLADGQDNDHGKQKKALAKEAWGLADRGLKAKPGGVEAHYYKALAIGAYSEAIGILTALAEGVESQFVENLEVAVKANEAFDRAGPLRAKGRYYAQLPWPKRDREKAVEVLNRAIKLSPEHSRSHLYLAEVLLQAGKPKEALTAIRKVFALKLDFDPPEGRRVLNWAKPIAEQIDAELK